jgi:hypothetical protein
VVRVTLIVTALSIAFVFGHTTGAQDEVAKKPAPRKVEFIGMCHYYGTVTGISGTTLTLSSPGWRYGRSTPLPPDGIPVTEWVQVPPEAVRQFRWSCALASGGSPGNRGDNAFREGIGEPSTSHTYRVTHLQLGDAVDVVWCRVDGIDVCDSFSIVQRRGGTIPPCPGDESRGPTDRKLLTLETSRHHERFQAIQEWELHGTPLPEWMRIVGPYLEVPYPPTAPAPRPVGLSNKR